MPASVRSAVMHRHSRRESGRVSACAARQGSAPGLASRRRDSRSTVHSAVRASTPVSVRPHARTSTVHATSRGHAEPGCRLSSLTVCVVRVILRTTACAKRSQCSDSSVTGPAAPALWLRSRSSSRKAGSVPRLPSVAPSASSSPVRARPRRRAMRLRAAAPPVNRLPFEGERGGGGEGADGPFSWMAACISVL